MLCGVVFALCVAGAATARAEAPRYRFLAGQELHFAGAKKNWFSEKPTESKSSWRLWVTQVNQDESADIVVEAGPDADSKYLVRMTVHPDGMISWNATMEALPAWLSVRRILPMLPGDEESLKTQWTHTEPRTGTRWDYRCQRNSDSLTILATCRGPLELVSVGAMEFTWTFDISKGSITGSGAKGTWADYNERDEESIALTSTIQRDAESIVLFRDETQGYFKTVQEYRSRFMPHDWARRVRATVTVGTDVQEEQGRTLLERGKSRSTDALVGEHYTKLLNDHDKRGTWIKSSLKEYEKIVDKQSPEWIADDLDGKPYRLADYLGKVVVLDFWFRKCNYCIRAQPQFDVVIERFKDKPVQFFGMNVDENIEDARFAVSKLHQAYPTLQAKKAQEQYGFGGAPIWLILDQQGVVRSIHVGYSGRLQEELTESIDNLLK